MNANIRKDALRDQRAKMLAAAPDWRASDARVTAQVFHDVMTTDMRGELGAVTAPVTLLYAQDDSLMPGGCRVENDKVDEVLAELVGRINADG